MSCQGVTFLQFQVNFLGFYLYGMVTFPNYKKTLGPRAEQS